MLTYNQNGTSRGIASIVFSKPDTAAKAAKDLNGLLVDGRPMKIEVVVDANHAPEVPAAKPLGERVAYVYVCGDIKELILTWKQTNQVPAQAGHCQQGYRQHSWTWPSRWPPRTWT